MKKITSDSPEKTREVAGEIARNAKPGSVYCLNGDLGAGKTEFAKGFAEAIGINEPITSPTFVIVNEYSGRLPLYHFDVYRIDEPQELYEVGFEDYIYGDGVCLIEWAERAEEMLPDSFVDIKINRTDNDNERIITIEEIN